MIAAEEWRKYEENYIRYGLDLQPDINEKREAKKNKIEERTKLKANASDRIAMLLIIFAVAFCMVAIIFFQAYAASIKYNINSLNREIDGLSNDIDNLNVELRSGSSLDSIEYAAINDLGMVYPGTSQTVDVTKLAGSKQVDVYIESLAASQRGFIGNDSITVADAARLLFAQS